MPFGQFARLEARRPSRRGAAADGRGRARLPGGAGALAAARRPGFRRRRLRARGLPDRRLLRRHFRPRLSAGGRASPRRCARAAGLPRSAWGTAFAHAGLGVTLLGLAATGWGVERIVAVKPGEAIDVGPTSSTFETIAPRQGPNYSENVGHADDPLRRADRGRDRAVAPLLPVAADDDDRSRHRDARLWARST